MEFERYGRRTCVKQPRKCGQQALPLTSFADNTIDVGPTVAKFLKSRLWNKVLGGLIIEKSQFL